MPYILLRTLLYPIDKESNIYFLSMAITYYDSSSSWISLSSLIKINFSLSNFSIFSVSIYSSLASKLIWKERFYFSSLSSFLLTFIFFFMFSNSFFCLMIFASCILHSLISIPSINISWNLVPSLTDINSPSLYFLLEIWILLRVLFN